MGTNKGTHDDSGAARDAGPLRALAARGSVTNTWVTNTWVTNIWAVAGVYLLERLVGATSGTVPKRLRHRGGPLQLCGC